jgi:hypothetical protein
MPRRHYTNEFRQECVNLLLSSGRGLKRGRPSWASRPMRCEPDAVAEIRRLQRENDYLRRQREILKKSHEHTLRGPAERYALIDAMRENFQLAELCKALGVSRSGYYAARKRPTQARGLMRGRLADGRSWEPFHEFHWGGSYIEGGPWQHSFNVPHDPLGLAALHGGSESLLHRLDTMLAMQATYESGS